MIFNQTFTIFRQDFEYDINSQPVIGKDGQKKMISLNLGNLKGIVTKHTSIVDPVNNSIIIGQRVFSRIEPNNLELKAGDLVVIDNLKLEVETISPIYWADGTIWQYTLIMKTDNTTLYA